jgi:hypothetical protein
MKLFAAALLLVLAVQPGFANPVTGSTPGQGVGWAASLSASAADVCSTAGGLLASARPGERAGQEDSGERDGRDKQIRDGAQGGRIVIKGKDGTVTGVERKPGDRSRDDAPPPRK